MSNNIKGNENKVNEPVLLKMENIEKAFPGVKALDNVSLTVKPVLFMLLWEKMAQENPH